ncbi:MAG: hypothetical protein ACW97P_10660 [Candidatus Hodarchaeales archaeon]|jgi:hypothetical protein
MTSNLQVWKDALKEIEKKEKKLRYGKRRWRDLSKEEKMATCYHRTGYFLFSKMLNGDTKRQPLYCNLCPECYARHAEDHEIKFLSIAKKAKRSHPRGVWRKKVVSTGNEAEALKKRISRNQRSRHTSIPLTEDTEIIWTFAVDEPGTDMNQAYGEKEDPIESTNWLDTYTVTRETGKKVSYGGGLRKKKASPKSEGETVKIPTPQVLIEKSQIKRAEDIIYRTNYIKEATTPEELVKTLHSQFYRIISSLEAAGIKIIAVKDSYTTMSVDKALTEWNESIKNWEKWHKSENASSVKDNEGKKDFYDLLYYPAKKKAVNSVSKREKEAMEKAFALMNR